MSESSKKIYFVKILKILGRTFLVAVTFLCVSLFCVVKFLDSKYLPPIVEQIADDYIDVKLKVGGVKLGFKLGFPILSVEVDSLTLTSNAFASHTLENLHQSLGTSRDTEIGVLAFFKSHYLVTPLHFLNMEKDGGSYLREEIVELIRLLCLSSHLAGLCVPVCGGTGCLGRNLGGFLVDCETEKNSRLSMLVDHVLPQEKGGLVIGSYHTFWI